MTSFNVEIIIENKKMARDPEGETITRDLINRGGFQSIKNVRTGKYLKLSVEAENEEEAENIVREMSNSLRIYNPVVHTCSVRIKK